MKDYSGLYWRIKCSYPIFYRSKIHHLVGFMSETTLDGPNRVIKKHIGACRSVLDIGAGDKAVKKIMQKAGHDGIFHTVDHNPTFSPDFSDLSSVDRSYDVILMLNIIEHLTLDAFYKQLDFCLNHLSPRGSLIIATPNANHINAIWRSDYTHVKPYPLRDLFGLLSNLGFEVDMYKIHVVEERYGFLRWVRRILAEMLAWTLYCDGAEDVMVVATRKGNG